MLIKFLKHSTGSGKRAISYLLGEKDHKGNARAGVRVLRGDAYLIGDLIDSLDSLHRYSSGVIAFHPNDQPSEIEIQNLLEDFERIGFAGLDSDQYSWCAVEHLEDDGSKHIHLVVPRIELTTGKSMNIAPPGHEYFFDKWRDSWNYKKGWTSPKDQAVSRIVNKKQKNLPDWVALKESNKDIKNVLAGYMLDGRIKNRSELVGYLNKLGEVKRAGSDYISFKPKWALKPIRLKGGVYAEDWVYVADMKNNVAQPNLEASEAMRKKLTPLLEKRAAYNRKRYEKPVVQALNINEMDEVDNEFAIDSDPADVVGTIEQAERINREAARFIESISKQEFDEFNISAERAIEETERAIGRAKQSSSECNKIIAGIKQGLSFAIESGKIVKELINGFKKEASEMLSQFASKEMQQIISANAERYMKDKIKKEEKEEEDVKELFDLILNDGREDDKSLAPDGKDNSILMAALDKIAFLDFKKKQDIVVEWLESNKCMSRIEAVDHVSYIVSSDDAELWSEFDNALLSSIVDQLKPEFKSNDVQKIRSLTPDVKINPSNDFDGYSM